MNRLIRPVLATRQVLQRRSLISSLETGGHAHAKEGYALFTKHPAWYRYLGKFSTETKYLIFSLTKNFYP